MAQAALVASLVAIGCPSEEAIMFLEKPLVWRAVACVLAYAFVVGGPTLAKPVWEDAVALFPTKQSAQIWIPVIANCLVQVGFLLAMLPLYAFGLCNQWRVEKDKPWPWQAAAAASERERFWRAARRSALLVPFNAVFLGQASLRYIVLPINPMIGALATDIASFPTPFTLFWQLAGCMVVEDFMFYWTHRTMHSSKYLYRNVHKWHHEYTTVACFASEHAHPIEFIVGNLGPIIAGPLLLRSHLFTVFMWTLLRVFISVEEHSGFSFPWSPVRLLPFLTSPDGHDFHHSHNVGVYASMFIFWDHLFGTDAPFLEHLRKKQQRSGAAQVPASPRAGAGGGATTRARAKAA